MEAAEKIIGEPNDQEHYNALKLAIKASIFSDFKRFAEAEAVIAELQKIASKESKVENIHWPLGEYSLRKGLYTLEPNYQMLNLELGNFTDAIKHLDKAIETSPKTMPNINRWMFWNYRAQAYEGLNQLDEAIADYEYVLHIVPSEPRTLLSLTKLYKTKGDLEKARKLAEKLVTIKTDLTSYNDAAAQLCKSLL